MCMWCGPCFTKLTHLWIGRLWVLNDKPWQSPTLPSSKNLHHGVVTSVCLCWCYYYLDVNSTGRYLPRESKVSLYMVFPWGLGYPPFFCYVRGELLLLIGKCAGCCSQAPVMKSWWSLSSLEVIQQPEQLFCAPRLFDLQSMPRCIQSAIFSGDTRWPPCVL